MPTLENPLDEFREKPSNPEMARLEELVKEREHIETVLTKLEDQVKRGKKRLEQLDGELIPDALDACSQEECVIKGLGIRVSIKEDVYASIPAQTTIDKCKDDNERVVLQERRDGAMTWIEENAPDVIKRSFEILFGRSKEDQKLADKFERDLAQRKRPLPVLRSAVVHPQTLNSLVRERLEQGDPVPRDLLGVYTKRVAKITKKG